MSETGRLWGVVALLTFLHLLFRVALGVGAAAPDLLTVALLVAARGTGPAGGAATGFGFGLLEDAFALLSFGSNTVALTVTGILGGFTRDLFVGDSRLFQVSYIFMGKLLRDALYWFLAEPSVRDSFVDRVLVFGSMQAAYAALVGVLLFSITGVWGEEEQ